MNENIETVLYGTAALIFEELGFMFSDRELSETQQTAQFEAAAAVDFKGAFEGRVVVQLYGNILSNLTENMLGEDGPPNQQIQWDALKEIANVICGNILPAVAGPEKLFNLSGPQIIEKPEVMKKGSAPSSETQIGIDEGRAEILLFMSGSGGSDGGKE